MWQLGLGPAHPAPTECHTRYGGFRASGSREFDGVLDHIADDVVAGRPPPPGLSHSFIVFIPKGEVHEDDAMTARIPSQLRPISLVQCSAQLIVAAADQALSRYAARTVCGQQRGFIPGRSSLDDVVELGGGMVKHSMAADTMPGGLLSDFDRAFPSLSHAWLFRVLRRMLIPSGLLRIVEALYTVFPTTILFCGQEAANFSATSGIKQL